mmetsp:Transcript_85094/g.133904  ORF Transcript_85094/g.133904 Transcript_85094/m.133904 type:complete len:91 (+) Transcript_85094:2-274(+)
MNTPNQLREIADLLGMPELHRRIRQAPMGDEDEGKVAEDLEDIAFLVDERTARQISDLGLDKERCSRQVSELSTSPSSSKKREQNEALGA